MRSHVIFISETKIDNTYPNSQFALAGYSMYRRDRKKGGGGLIGYFDSNLPSKELKMVKAYKTLEILAIEVRIDSKDILLMGIYRPPKQSGNLSYSHYLERVEEELNDICMWASLK